MSRLSSVTINDEAMHVKYGMKGGDGFIWDIVCGFVSA
jgi:hypothetical protein